MRFFLCVEWILPRPCFWLIKRIHANHERSQQTLARHLLNLRGPELVQTQMNNEAINEGRRFFKAEPTTKEATSPRSSTASTDGRRLQAAMPLGLRGSSWLGSPVGGTRVGLSRELRPPTDPYGALCDQCYDHRAPRRKIQISYDGL